MKANRSLRLMYNGQSANAERCGYGQISTVYSYPSHHFHCVCYHYRTPLYCVCYHYHTPSLCVLSISHPPSLCVLSLFHPPSLCVLSLSHPPHCVCHQYHTPLHCVCDHYHTPLIVCAINIIPPFIVCAITITPSSLCVLSISYPPSLCVLSFITSLQVTWYHKDESFWQSLSTKHRTKSLTHQTGNYHVTCFVSRPSGITLVKFHSLQVTIKTNLLAELKHQAPN